MTRNNPLIALATAVIVVVAPLLIWRLATELRTMIDDPVLGSGDFLREVVLGLSFFSVLTGLSVGNLLPGGQSIGLQIRAAPIPGRLAALAGAVGPLVILAAFMIGLGAVFIGSLTAGQDNQLAVTVCCVAVVATVAMTAVLSAHAFQTGVRHGVLTGLVAVVGWAVGVAAAGPPRWGMLQRAVTATGAGAVTGVLLWTLLVVLATGASWYLATSIGVDPSRRAGRHRSVGLPPSFLGHAMAATLIVVRRRDVRRHMLGVVAAALVGTAALSYFSQIGASASLQLSLSLAMIGCIAIVLAAMAYSTDAPWLWKTSPDSPMARVAAGALAGIIVALVVYLGLALSLSLVVGAPLVDELLSSVGLLTVSAPAIVIGAVLPLRRNSGGDQYMSFVVLAGASLAWIQVTSYLANLSLWDPVASPTAVQIAMTCGLGPPIALLLARQLISPYSRTHYSSSRHSRNWSSRTKGTS